MEIQSSIATLVLGGLAFSCLLISGLFFWQEIGEVNRKKPENEQISYFGMYPQKYARIKKEYKRLYPKGRVHTIGFIFEVVGFILLFLTAVSAGFFKHLAQK